MKINFNKFLPSKIVFAVTIIPILSIVLFFVIRGVISSYSNQEKNSSDILEQKILVETETKKKIGKDTNEVLYITDIIVPTPTTPIISTPSEDGEISSLPDSDIIFTVNNINTRGVFESSKSDFSIDMSSDSSSILKFDDDLEMTLFATEATKIKSFFSFDEITNKLFIKSNKLEEFKSLLGNDQIDLDISGYDSIGSNISKEITFYYGYGTISGTLIDNNGQLYNGLEGETIELRGSFKGTSYETKIKSGSTFIFIDLPADTYNLSLLTSDYKVAVSSVLINSSSPSSNILMTVVNLKNTSAKLKNIN